MDYQQYTGYTGYNSYHYQYATPNHLKVSTFYKKKDKGGPDHVQMTKVNCRLKVNCNDFQRLTQKS